MARHLSPHSFGVILLYLCEWDRVKVIAWHIWFFKIKIGAFAFWTFGDPNFNLFSYFTKKKAPNSFPKP
jgi:hypothetical protein